MKNIINKNIIILLITIAALAAAAVTGYCDVVHLRNGDRISGDVTLGEGMITVKPEYAEKVLVHFGNISKVDITRGRDTDEVKNIDDPLLKSVLGKAAEATEKKYPNAGIVYLYRDTDIKYNADRTTVEEMRVIFKVLKERGLDEANFVYSYDRDGESVTVSHARSISPEGLVSNLRGDATKITDKYLQFPVYNKVKILQFSVPEVRIGSIVDVKVVSKSSPCEMLDPFNHSEYFLGYEPTVVEKLKITVPKTARVELKKYFPEKGLPELSTEKSGESISYSYEAKDIPDFVPEPAMPPFPYFVQHIRFAERYPMREMAKELAARIGAAIKFDDRMKADLAALVAGKKTAREKAVAIYEHLATNIKGVHVSASIDNFRPTATDVIYREKYASNYDRSVLLYAFLREAGLKCDLCFGYNENYSPFDPDFFTIYDFSNLLVECVGEYLFADAEYYPYGVVSQRFYDNKYFRVFEYSDKLINLPRQKFERSYTDQSLEMKVGADGNTAFALACAGYGEDDPGIRASYKNAKPIKRKQAFEGIAAGIAKGGILKDYKLSDVENHSERACYRVEFESPNFVSKLGDMYMLVPIPYTSIGTRLVAKETRKFDMFFDTYDIDSTEVSIRIPDGYKVRYVPGSFVEDGEFEKISLSIEHDKKAGAIVFRRFTETKKKIVPASAYLKFKAQFEKAGQLRKERIILERTDQK